MNLWQWIQHDVRHRVASTLVVVWLMSFIRFHDAPHIVFLLIVVVAGTVVDALLHKLRGFKGFPSSAVVTCLLIALILAPENGILPQLVAVLFALASKHLLRFRRHWFNPAAFGIVASATLFHVPVAWWAVSWSWVPVVAIAVGVVPVLLRLKRLWLPVTFIAGYAAWLAVAVKNLSVEWRIVLDGTVILFALVMLPEPKTSPANGGWRYLFGPVVLGLVIVGSSIAKSVPIPDVFLAGLLAGDLIAGISQTLRRLRQSHSYPSVASSPPMR